MLEKIMPRLPLNDVPAGVQHYRDVLAFKVNDQRHDLGVTDRDEVRPLLIARTGRSGTARATSTSPTLMPFTPSSLPRAPT
jgi:hypothetical protein